MARHLNPVVHHRLGKDAVKPYVSQQLQVQTVTLRVEANHYLWQPLTSDHRCNDRHCANVIANVGLACS